MGCVMPLITDRFSWFYKIFIVRANEALGMVAVPLPRRVTSCYLTSCNGFGHQRLTTVHINWCCGPSPLTGFVPHANRVPSKQF